MAPTVALVSLGCPKNLVDSEIMLGLLAEAGYEVVEEAEGAEVVIVNTCAFIEPAVEEAVEALLDLSDLKTRGTRCLICAGCLTARYREELRAELPEVDAFIGPGAVPRIADVVERGLAGERPYETGEAPWLYQATTARMRSGQEWLAYAKIADGCSHRCAYCMIPTLRGPYRSRPADDIRAEIAGLIAEDVREICLIAQDTSAWGRDLPGQHSPAELLRALELGSWEGWVRLMYLHPDGMSEALLSAVSAIAQVVPYFDLPLQHSDRALLRRMGRRGDAESYLALLGRIRATLPEAAIRTTFIVGYPGESRAQFEGLLRFVEQARFDRLSAFRYWDEPGTRAERLGAKVDPAEAQDRLDELMELQAGISREINEGFVGRRLRVLVEEPGPERGEMLGRSYRDAPEVDGNVLVTGPGADELRPGTFVEVIVRAALEHDLRAELVDGR